jgi:anti-sigma factor RsiW
MTCCRDLEELLTPYLDEELDPTSRARVKEHLASCPPCRAAAEAEAEARSLLRARCADLRAAASPTLHSRCRAAASHSPATGHRARMIWLPLSVAAALLLVIGGVFLIGPGSSQRALAAELTLDHKQCFMYEPSATATPEQLAAQWQARNNWSIVVPPSAPELGLELKGLRPCSISNGLMAHLMYRSHGHQISLFIFPERNGVASVPAVTGNEMRVWVQDHVTYALVGDDGSAEMDRLMEYVRRFSTSAEARTEH